MPYYFYIYNISICDFGAIQTPRAEIYIFTMGTPYKISSRILVFASLWTGIFTVECACPEPFRIIKELITRQEREFQASECSQAQVTVSKFQRNLAHAKLKTQGLRVDSLASAV
jgi:hypothetical protein